MRFNGPNKLEGTSESLARESLVKTDQIIWPLGE